MNSFEWEELSGTILPDGFALKKVLQETPSFALFNAHSMSESLQPEALVEVVLPQEDPQMVVNRFLEASYLRHPHLAGISAAGMLEDRALVYAVAEPFDHTLSHFVAQRPLPQDDAIELVDQLVSALAYLHSENLVFCNLRPESIWRTAAEWKLGDFSQLRIIGSGHSRDLRAALARRPDLPPEVYEGMVSPAWDVWSLGVLLRRILAPQPSPQPAVASLTSPGPRGRHLRSAELPAPFDTIARDCLDPDPAARITLDEIRARLHPAKSAVPFGRTVATPAGRIMSFFRQLPERSAKMKALVALGAAVLLLAILVSANSLLRHGDSEPTAVAQSPPPPTISEADRSVPPTAGALPATRQEEASNNTPVPDDVRTLLNKWVLSTKVRDIKANLNCYAPSVDNYYTKQRLSRKDMEREKQRQFGSIGTVHSLKLEHVKFNRLSADRAVVLFDKRWSFGDRNPFSGYEQAQLTLRNMGGEWKIAGERELKIYWVKHSRAS